MYRMIAAASLLSTLIAGGAVNAMPLTPLVARSEIIAIAGGCGAGWHRGPFGGCRRNFADPDAHACPRGYHIGPGGGCRGNGR